jgi:hypothetical protein
MRELIINRITDFLSESKEYAIYINGYGDYASKRHDEVVASLQRLTDQMLLSLYTRMIQGSDIIPCSVDADGRYADIRIKGIYGGMIDDGSIHT